MDWKKTLICVAVVSAVFFHGYIWLVGAVSVYEQQYASRETKKLQEYYSKIKGEK